MAIDEKRPRLRCSRHTVPQAHQTRGGFSGRREVTTWIKTTGSARSDGGGDPTAADTGRSLIHTALQQAAQMPHLWVALVKCFWTSGDCGEVSAMPMWPECSCCTKPSSAAWCSITGETCTKLGELEAPKPQKSIDAAAKPCRGSASIISHSSSVRKRNIERQFYINKRVARNTYRLLQH